MSKPEPLNWKLPACGDVGMNLHESRALRVLRDLSKITWGGTGEAGKRPRRTLMKAPKLSFKSPSLWLSISLNGVIWTCPIIYNSLLGPRASDLFFWSHGKLGFWPAKKSNPARQSSSQTPSGCASLDIDISLTLSFPLQHELLITWIPSGISSVMKEQRFCLNTLSRTDCFLWIKLLICVYVCACICRT